MSTEQFNEEQQDVLRKVEKLMRLAAKNANENEAAAANAKAQELLTAYNLSAAEIDIDGETTGKRAEEALIGGFYRFERDLWRAIAELNYLWYFTRTKWIPYEERKKHRNRTRTHQHILIGKTVNIAGTKAMAGYLMQTIERLTKETITELKANTHPRSSWAVSFRQGVAERVIEKIQDRFQKMVDAEEKRARKAERDARRAGVANVDTALTIPRLQEKEYEANYDFKYGKGAWAKRQREQLEWQQQRAKARAEAEAEYTAWAAANPEDAAKAEKRRIAEERKEQRRWENRRPRYRRAPEFKGDWHAYSLGREAGKKVGIDPQTKGRATKGLLK